MDSNKPTIETKAFKLEDGSDFILEYPSNYNELVDKKLAKLDSEYEETLAADKKEVIDGNNMDNIKDKEENKEDEDNDEGSNNDKDGYEQIGGYNQLNEDDFVEVKEDEDGEGHKESNQNNNKEENIEQQVITVSNKTNAQIIDDNMQNNIIKDNEPNNIITDIEFIEESTISPTKKKEEGQFKRKCSPVKNPEKIKETMRTIKIKPPKWAENLSDEDFIKRAKQYLNKQ